MRALIVLLVLFLGALTALFVAAARAIRRDLTVRFDQLRVRLEAEANAVIAELLKEHKRT